MIIDELFEAETSRIIVTYPGRFQPFHQGHHAVFQILQKTFGANNVYILTSDKTDSKKSPFNFADKLVLMTSAGVPKDKIIETSNMYSLPEEFNAQNTIFIAALGAPDADRLRPDTVTAKDTTDKFGNFKPAGSPSYYKSWTGQAPIVTADKHGYVYVVPEIHKAIELNGVKYDVSHGTECRELWNQIRHDKELRHSFLTQLYGKSSKKLENIFDKIPYTQPSNEDLSPMGQSTVSPISGNVKEEAAGVGVIANKKTRKDPRYSTSLTKDVKPGAIQHALRGFRLAENNKGKTKQINEFNPLIAAAAVGAGLAAGAGTAIRNQDYGTKTLQQQFKEKQRQDIDKAIQAKIDAQTDPIVGQQDQDKKLALPETQITEKWSTKYKKSIDCSNPKGFSQRAHCAGRKARKQGRNTISNRLNESNHDSNFITYLENMLKIAMEQLELAKIPQIKLHKHLETHDGQATFGRYLNDKNVIHLALEGRHPVDILRTLAHELVHFKQNLENKLNNLSGETGSPEENAAHAVAGIIMRKFNKLYPNAINSKPLL